MSSKHQVTIPVDAMRVAGFSAGDRLRVRDVGAGWVLFERDDDRLDASFGSCSGMWEGFDLDELRDEWA